MFSVSCDVLFARPQKIQPVRADGNLLLCTLLLGNVAVNALLSIVMAQLTSGLVGFALATVIITIFGEIIPQVPFYRPPKFNSAVGTFEN